jgi:hypothetical protein
MSWDGRGRYKNNKPVKKYNLLIITLFAVACLQVTLKLEQVWEYPNSGSFSPVSMSATTEIPSFVKSHYFDEQVLAYTYKPGVADIIIEINAPSASEFDAQLPTALVFYGLPNDNKTAWTIGKEMKRGDDGRFDMQHIGAQTRFARIQNLGYNLVTAYMEVPQLSWGTWRLSTPNGDALIKECVESIMEIFESYNPYVVLSGHGGGGNLVFGFLDATDEIPAYVKRISFLDSNNNWDNNRYGSKIVNWLRASNENYLSVIAYNDSVALLNGQPIVSATESTWYRSRMMQKYLKANLQYTWTETADADFVRYAAENNRIQFILKTNPSQEVYHTLLVKKNGYIQANLSGSNKEGVNYTFWETEAYSSHIQESKIYPQILRIPPRRKNAEGGAAFMQRITSMSIDERDEAIFEEISNGNIPNAFRKVNHITKILQDANNVSYLVEIEIMPDFLAIGSDQDFCRIPMLPLTAQRIVTLFGASLPTSKISDLAWEFAEIKLDPWSLTTTPDTGMVTVPRFIQHNQMIEEQRVPLNKQLSTPITGHKKDIIITNRMATDTNGRNSVYIYGWHQLPSGEPIQNIYGGHGINYTDYSHGTRVINQEMLINGEVKKISDILRDPVKYRLISKESGAMTITAYIDTTKTVNPI